MACCPDGEETMRAAFAALDRDGDGKLGVEDLAAAVTAGGHETKAQTLKHLARGICNEDGGEEQAFMSFETFRDTVSTYAGTGKNQNDHLAMMFKLTYC